MNRKIIDYEIIKLNDEWSIWFIKDYHKEIFKNGFDYCFEYEFDFYNLKFTDKETKFYYFIENSEPVISINPKDLYKPLIISNKDAEILKTILDITNLDYKDFIEEIGGDEK